MFFKNDSLRWVVVATIAIALLLGAPLIDLPGGVSAAYAAVYTFYPSVGDWKDGNNWRIGGAPADGYPDDQYDDAIIPAGKIAQVSTETPLAVGSIDVQADGETKGFIYLYTGTLARGTTREVESIVDGCVLFVQCDTQEGCTQPRLHVVNDDVVIKSREGESGQIRGAVGRYVLGFGNLVPGLITYEDENNDEFELLIKDDVIIAGQIEVRVVLNNQSTVLVDDDRPVQPDPEEPNYLLLEDKDTMLLSKPKIKTANSSGRWLCQGGTLKVACEVTGAGAWILENPAEITGNNDSLIWITDDADTVADGLSGPVTITGGVFLAEDDFCTSGKIIYRSPQDDIKPLIKVAEDVSAKFSLSCP